MVAVKKKLNSLALSKSFDILYVPFLQGQSYDLQYLCESNAKHVQLSKVSLI